jgi:hypothetical protein
LKLYANLLRRGGLTDWERSFIESLRDREPIEWSDKQLSCLRKIVKKWRPTGNG